MLLQVNQCGVQFGGLRALREFSLELGFRELVGIIGPNGAGKTTFFNLLTGVYRPTEGEITFDGNGIIGLKPYQISQRGIARTFQNIRLFHDLSVEDNVLVSFYAHLQTSLIGGVMRNRHYRREALQCREESERLLDMFHLAPLKREVAKNLSYGDQRRLEIVRALATKPKLLLLDEPAAGMNPTEKKELIAWIRRIHQELPLAILMIEHDMSVMMSLCPRLIVLDYGEIIATGTPDEIRRNPKVIEAYLGTEE